MLKQSLINVMDKILTISLLLLDPYLVHVAYLLCLLGHNCLIIFGGSVKRNMNDTFCHFTNTIHRNI